MSKPAAAAAAKKGVAAAADTSNTTKKTGAVAGPLDKRLQVKTNADEDDWSKWNIQELRTSMVEDRANLQASAWHVTHKAATCCTHFTLNLSLLPPGNTT